jgi:hypothetical protein
MCRYTMLVGLALTAFVGCDVEGLYDERFEINSFERVEAGLVVWFTAPGEELVLLEPAVDDIAVKSLFKPEDGERIERLEVGPDPRTAEEVFAFTAPIDEREIELVDSVVRITPGATDGSGQGVAPVRFPLGSKFGAMEFHPAGRFAILYHPPSDSEGGAGLFNQNEVAVIDLSRAPAADSPTPAADNPRVLTIDMGGRSVEGVDFPGPLTVDGLDRDFAVFEADGAIVLLDLADPAFAPVAVKLKNEDDTRVIVPEQILARQADETHDPMLILRAPGAQEIFAVALVPRPDGQPGFVTALNQFDSGASQPTAMALVEDAGNPLLVVAGYGVQRVAVIDVGTASSFYIDLDGTVSALLQHVRADGAPEVVMYGESQRIYFLAVEDLAEEKGSNLEEVFIEDGVETAWLFGADALLAEPYSGYGLTLIDLTERDVTRLTSDEGYSWSDADAYGDMLFYAGVGDDRVIGLDLESGHPDPLVLDEPVAAFEIFPASGAGIVLHDTPSGRATLFKLADPRREVAVVIDGLWLRGLLDETEVQP